MPRERLYQAVAQQWKKGYTLQRLCLWTIGGIHIVTHRLKGGICEIRRWDAMIYILSFMKIDSSIQTLMLAIHRHTDSMVWKAYTYFFQNKECTLTRISGKKSSPNFLRYDMHRIDHDASNNFSIVTSVFVAKGTCLPSRCLTRVGEGREFTHRQRARWSQKPTFFKVGKVR
jgi:hypothetical protein